MPPKMSRRAQCAFCGSATENADDYVEIEVTSPTALGRQRQLFGAHGSCMTEAMEGSTQVELDLLNDDSS